MIKIIKYLVLGGLFTIILGVSLAYLSNEDRNSTINILLNRIGETKLKLGAVEPASNFPEHLQITPPGLISVQELNILRERVSGPNPNDIVTYIFDNGPMDESIPSYIESKAQSKGLSITREDISKRTPSSRVFNTSSSTLKIFQGISGSQWYTVNGQWRSYQTATTTRDAYERQTGKQLIHRDEMSKFTYIISKLTSLALADSNTLYPDPDTESTSVDGDVNNQNDPGIGWSSCLTYTGQSAVDNGTTITTMMIRSDVDLTEWECFGNGIYVFDTSPLGTGATVTDAVFSLKPNLAQDNLSITPDMNVYSSNPTSDTTIIPSDMDDLGSTEFSTTKSWATLLAGVGSYIDYTLNAAGIAAIDTTTGTGRTKLSTRNANYEVAENEPTQSDQQIISFVNIDSADTTGTDSDPKLVITYTPGVGGGGTDGVNTQTFFIMSLLNKFLNTAMAKK